MSNQTLKSHDDLVKLMKKKSGVVLYSPFLTGMLNGNYKASLLFSFMLCSALDELNNRRVPQVTRNYQSLCNLLGMRIMEMRSAMGFLVEHKFIDAVPTASGNPQGNTYFIGKTFYERLYQAYEQEFIDDRNTVNVTEVLLLGFPKYYIYFAGFSHVHDTVTRGMLLSYFMYTQSLMEKLGTHTALSWTLKVSDLEPLFFDRNDFRSLKAKLLEINSSLEESLALLRDPVPYNLNVEQLNQIKQYLCQLEYLTIYEPKRPGSPPGYWINRDCVYFHFAAHAQNRLLLAEPKDIQVVWNAIEIIKEGRQAHYAAQYAQHTLEANAVESTHPPVGKPAYKAPDPAYKALGTELVEQLCEAESTQPPVGKPDPNHRDPVSNHRLTHAISDAGAKTTIENNPLNHHNHHDSVEETNPSQPAEVVVVSEKETSAPSTHPDLLDHPNLALHSALPRDVLNAVINTVRTAKGDRQQYLLDELAGNYKANRKIENPVAWMRHLIRIDKEQPGGVNWDFALTIEVERARELEIKSAIQKGSAANPLTNIIHALGGDTEKITPKPIARRRLRRMLGGLRGNTEDIDLDDETIQSELPDETGASNVKDENTPEGV